MANEGRIIGWKLRPQDREALLRRFPPRWPDTIADHVTLATNAASRPLPPRLHATIIGEADDGKGVQALVVSIGGTTHRPDGGHYHITWSLDRALGREAVESNDVIARHGWVVRPARSSRSAIPKTPSSVR